MESCGRVLNGELYAQRFENLIYLHLSTDCFMKLLFTHCPTSEEKSSVISMHKVLISNFHDVGSICCTPVESFKIRWKNVFL